MNRTEAWFVHGATILVGVTGIIYAVMRYFIVPSDPFSVVNHPWQPHMQHLHVLVAPLMVFAVGLIWKKHIAGHWRSGLKTGRRSGIGMIMTMVPMILSGYMIQITVTDTWRTTWIVVHCVTSGLWVAGYVIHQIASMKKRREKNKISNINPLTPQTIEPADPVNHALS